MLSQKPLDTSTKISKSSSYHRSIKNYSKIGRNSFRNRLFSNQKHFANVHLLDRHLLFSDNDVDIETFSLTKAILFHPTRFKALEEVSSVLSAERNSSHKYISNFNLSSVVMDTYRNSISEYLQINDDNNVFSNISRTITREIDSLNDILTSYTKEYLGMIWNTDNTKNNIDKRWYFEDSGHEDLYDMTTVDKYINRSGELAGRLGLRVAEMVTCSEDDIGYNYNVNNNENSLINVETKCDEKDLENIGLTISKLLSESTGSVPNIFFDPHFDLADPKLFEALILNNNDTNLSNSRKDNKKISTSSSLKINIYSLDKLTQYFDTIELALLDQVRSKSHFFFRELKRFSALKTTVCECIDTVQSLRSSLMSMRNKLIDVEDVPKLDIRRENLFSLNCALDGIENFLAAKGSIRGLINAGNHTQAIKTVRLTHLLLRGEDNEYKEENTLITKNYILKQTQNQRSSKGPFKLRKHIVPGNLVAFNNVTCQLVQYENIVVLTLSNELVEIFISWNGEYKSSSDKNISKQSNLRLKIIYSISVLKMCRELTALSDLYREKLVELLRLTIRTTVVECAEDRNVTTIDNNNFAIGNDIMKEQQGEPQKYKKKENYLISVTSIYVKSVASMSCGNFINCLDMLFEQILILLYGAMGVNNFCREVGISLRDDEKPKVDKELVENVRINTTSSSSALFTACDLSQKFISELIRLRKETYTFSSFENIKQFWDSCYSFTVYIENLSGQKAYALRSAMLAQAKAFIECKHKENMTNLTKSLEEDKWTPCHVSLERQSLLTKLCTGQLTEAYSDIRCNKEINNERVYTSSRQDVEIKGTHYKVVCSCLLTIELIIGTIACGVHFPALVSSVVGKVSVLLRLFNTQTSQMVLGARALKSSTRLKSINARHLSMVTQSLGLVIFIHPYIRTALMAQLPKKQHTLLFDVDKIKTEFTDHNDAVLNKFVVIMGNIVEHSLLKKFVIMDFDARANEKDILPISNRPVEETSFNIFCCPFFQGIITSILKMHNALNISLPRKDLIDVFSRIYAHLDSRIPAIIMAVDRDESSEFNFPSTYNGKTRLIQEMEIMFTKMNMLPGVKPWEFSATKCINNIVKLTQMNNLPVIIESSVNSLDQCNTDNSIQ